MEKQKRKIKLNCTNYFCLVLFSLGLHQVSFAQYRFLTRSLTAPAFKCCAFSDSTIVSVNIEYDGGYLSIEKYTPDGQTRIWQEHYDFITDHHTLISLQKFPDDCMVLLSNFAFNDVCALAKIDSTRNIIFANYYYPVTGQLNSRDMIIDSQTNFVVVGNYFGNGTYDGYVMKVDSSGNTIWGKRIHSDNWIYFESVRQKNDSTYIVFGRDSSAINVIVEMDLDGTVRNVHRYSMTPNYFNLYGGILTYDNGYLFYGLSNNQQGGIIKIDSNYAVSWSIFLSRGSHGDFFHRAYELKDHSLLLSYRSDSVLYWEMLIKLDSAGNHVWTKLYDSGNYPTLGSYGVVSMTEALDGGYILHSCNSVNNAVMKTDAAFNLGCNQCSYLSQSYSLPTSQLPVSSPYVTLLDTVISAPTYFTRNSGMAGPPWFLCSSIVTGIKNEWTKKNEEIVFPNPGTDYFSIRSPEPGSVSQVRLVNQLSQEIRKWKITPEFSNRFNIGDLPAGIYLIEMLGEKSCSQSFFIKM